MKSVKSNENRLDSFIKSSDFSDGGVSKIWSVLRKDFQNKNGSLRGYGLVADISVKRVYWFRKLHRYISLPFRAFCLICNSVQYTLERVLSALVFGGGYIAVQKCGYLKYELEKYNQEDLVEFEKKYCHYNIGFSHNTFKAYTYLKDMQNVIEQPKDLCVFEIGAGVFNFGHLLSLEVRGFEYVVCDLPEVIQSAFVEINDRYIPDCGGDYEVFLPTEIHEFEISTSSRKILFITPQQLKDNCLGGQKRFDLFVNCESFSEMDIDVVNSYLSYLPKLMKRGAFVFLVNRFSRAQATTHEDFKGLELGDLTNFMDYRLDFCRKICMRIDPFRAGIVGQQQNPNIFYIGEILD